MDHQMKDTFCKQINAELAKIASMPSLNDSTLAQLHLLTDTKKNLLKIEKLEMETEGMSGGNSYRNDGYSSRYGYEPMYRNSYDGGYSRANSYDGGYSRANSYDGGYSRADVHSHLEAAMREARNDQEREEIRQIMSRYHN